jgi:DNA invertase Pin-like site-specific DNA recombinase
MQRVQRLLGRGVVFASGLAQGVCGERNGAAKLTAEAAIEIRSLAADGQSVSALAQRFGVHRETVRAVLDGGTWQPDRVKIRSAASSILPHERAA